MSERKNPKLTISTLGRLSIRLGDEPVTGFASRKVEALLVYLACTGRPRPREVVAEMLWEERSQSQALANLRVVLSSLRKHLGPYVTITRDTVALNPDADIWLDAAEMERKLNAGQVEEAVALYQGDFLEGFFVRDSPDFEDWAAIERERLRRLALDGLCDLVADCLETGEYQAGIRHAARLLVLDPLMEEAHRQMMRLLACSGQRGAALEQYETCCRLLAEELGIEPTEETVALCERIRAGELDVPLPTPIPPSPIPPHLPAFLAEEARAVERPTFVAREGELARLNQSLEMALAGTGQVIFVTGGAGRGKTTLVQEFARRALDATPELLVAAGNCNPYSGVGDPYLPFRGVLGMLTGDVEPRWAAGTITTAHARRLWAAVPQVMQALIAHGSFLIDLFIPGRALMSQAAAAAPTGADWLPELERLVEGSRYRPPDLAQHHLFDQYAAVLRALSAHHPLLLLLDDMQWADTGSTGLLYHLGQKLEGSRVLIVCAYRPDEVALGRSSTGSGQGERHPLDKVLAEFKRTFGDIWVDLAQADETEGRRFVDAFLDSEPNRLGKEFRSGLFHHTGGHALFTVELLRAMQERGDLVQDAKRYWVPALALDWTALPARVEAVIAERIGRLEDELREVLSIASVEGEDFTAQVVARVQEISERKLLRDLSQELEKRHRLVREQGSVRVGSQTLSRYRFAHALFQQYLYNDLGEGERRLLHRATAEALQALYEVPAAAVWAQLAHQWTPVNVAELAYHWERAGEPEKAAEYLRRSGEQLYLMRAPRDAISLYERALALLAEDEEAIRAAVLVGKGWAHNDAGDDLLVAMQHLEKGRTLSRKAGLPIVEASALRGLACIAARQGRYDEARGHAEKGVALAREINDPRSLGICLARLGWVVLQQGDIERAEKCAEESLALWSELGEQRWIAQSLTLLADVAGFQREYGKQKQYLEQSLTICRNIGDQGWASDCLNNLGEGARQQGKYEEAVRYYEEALAIKRELGDPAPWLINYLGHAHIGLDEDDIGWGYLHEALKELLVIERVSTMLEALVGVAWLQVKAGQYVRAAELLGLVLGHPALDMETKRYVEPVLVMVRDSLPSDELEAALERGKALDLEQVVAAILEEAE